MKVLITQFGLWRVVGRIQRYRRELRRLREAKLYRCKECGDISYTGNYCLKCDSNFFRYQLRRGWWLHFWGSGVLFTATGSLLLFFHWNTVISWIIWGIGIACFGMALANTFIWGKKIIRRKFEELGQLETEIQLRRRN